MLIASKPDIPSSEITPKDLYLNRRKFIAGMAATAAAAPFVGGMLAPEGAHADDLAKIPTVHSPLSTHGETVTPYKDITNYNNFYELSVDKYEPAALADHLKTKGWTVRVEGLVNKPQTFDIDKLMKLHAQEERIFRHRCVEAWSMVMPWVGYSLSELIKQVQPLSTAKYVQFLSIDDPANLPGQKSVVLRWPYSEGLRMDEAMNPLATLCFGLYGQALPNQDGAPVRMIVPWKYGYKSAKSIVKIVFVKDEPPTAWDTASPQEYGFYSNVNPNVDHPRWSQAKERRIGEFLKRPTLMFNGYGDQVASLYKGMDLRVYH
jgi:sulfoxide reductase catalytic subunit YedY